MTLYSSPRNQLFESTSLNPAGLELMTLVALVWTSQFPSYREGFPTMVHLSVPSIPDFRSSRVPPLILEKWPTVREGRKLGYVAKVEHQSCRRLRNFLLETVIG